VPERKRKKATEKRGLAPEEVPAVPEEARRLAAVVREDGGMALCAYRDPLGGTPVVLAALPVDRVEPTPYQRDASEAHVKRLAKVIDGLGRFLDPIITVREEGGRYFTPNGNHRLCAMRALGARTVTALVLPDPEAAFKILALNTEKAHNLREKSLEVIRMCRAMATKSGRRETDMALEFEEPAYLTLGVNYEQNGRFPGGAYHALLRRIDEFLDRPLARALEERQKRAARLATLDQAVGDIVDKLRARGLRSPYLRPFVVARVNPLRFKKGARAQRAPFAETLDKMIDKASLFDVDRIRSEDLSAAAGAPEES
jgi:ParB family transcriptional regulator, chromosome partitioning protein